MANSARDKGISRERYALIDSIRGICIWGMIIYHTLFDIMLVCGFDLNSPFMYAVNIIRDFGACCFIFLSGLCFHLGSRRLKRPLMIFACGIVVSLATYIVMPDSFVIFGILTFIGTAGLIMIPLSKLLIKLQPVAGLVLSFLLFLLFFSCNSGYVGYYSLEIAAFPAELYRNYFTAFLGFPFNGFISGDYYPVLPWIFMYFCGFFFWLSLKNKEALKRFLNIKIPFAEKTGKLSLYIYIIHQPVIFVLVGGIYMLLT